MTETGRANQLAGETEVPVVLRVFAEKSSSVNSVLEDTKKRFGDLAGNVAGVAKSAALLSGSFTLALGGIVSAAVNVAGQFEQLRAKLTATLGSSEAAARSFQQALEFAGNTPFDVQGIVKATIQITAFGQSAERVLPLASNLAAAFGGQVDEVGRTLGKAFSGSLEGFESLRNNFGISNVLLEKFGAELTKTGTISVNTSSALLKAQGALEKIIKTRFGDATAQQSQTLFGAMSNLGDAIQRVAAAFGTALIPAVTAVTRTLTSMVEVFERLSPETRQFAAFAALATVGLGALATAAAVLVGVVSTGLGGVTAFAGAIGAMGGATGAGAAASGLATISGSMGSLTSTVSGAASSFTALLSPITLIAAILGGAAFIALRNYEAATAKADKAIVAEAKALVEARNALNDYRDVIEKVTNSQGKLASQSGSVSQLAQALRESFANVTPADFLANAEKAGVTLEGLGKDAERNAASVNLFRGNIKDLQAALVVLENRKTNAIGAFTEENEAIVARVKELLGGMPPTVENVTAALGRSESILQKFIKAGLEISFLTTKTKEFSPVLEEVKTRAAGLQDFLKFASKTDDVDVLRASMAALGGEISAVEGLLGKLGIPYGSLVELQGRLLTGSTEEKAAIESLLGLRDAQENLQKKVAADEKKAIDDRIRAEEIGIERNKILKGESKAAEIKIYQELLGIVKAGSEEELSLLTKIANAKQGLKRAEIAEAKRVVAEVKQSLDNLTGSSNEGLEKLRATGEATAVQTSKALQGIIADLDEWAVKNKKLIDSTPQLAEEFRKVRLGFQTKLDSSELEKPKEKLREAIAAAKEFGTEAVTNTQKLAAAQQALTLLTNLQNSGSINTTKEKAALQAEINRLTKEELTTRAAVTKEADQQARQTSNLQREGLNTKLEMLKAEEEAQGKSTFRTQQIADLERQILAEKIQAIREQERAEIDARATAEQARERSELRITALKDQETLKRIKAEQTGTKSVEDEARKQQSIIEGLTKNRLGGANSPIQSLAEVSARSSFLGNFSLGDFGSGSGGGRAFPRSLGPPQQQLGRIQATIANDIAQGERLAGRGAAGGVAPTTVATTNNNYLTVQGQALGAEVKAAMRTIIEQYIQEDRHLRGA